MKTISRFLLIAAASVALLVTAQAQANVYNITGGAANGLQQIAGGPSAAVVAPTFAATVALDPNAGIYQKLAGVSTTSSTCTVSTPNVGAFGQMLVTQCAASSSGTVTYTFTTNFLPTATVAATSSKSILVLWFSDGVAWHECARSASAQ